MDEEGDVAAGDAIEPLERATHDVTVAEITRLYARDRKDVAALRRAAGVQARLGCELPSTTRCSTVSHCIPNDHAKSPSDHLTRQQWRSRSAR